MGSYVELGGDGASGSGASVSNATPQNVGTASAGVGSAASRDDHVHALPNVVTAATKGGSGKLIKQIQYDAQGRTIADVVEATAGTEYAAADNHTRALYIAKGLTLSGLTSDYGVLWEDFDRKPTPSDWTPTTAAGGTITAVAGTKSVSRLSTSATINGNAQTITSEPILGALNVDRWYFAWRFRVPSTPDANTRLGLGLANTGQTRAVMAGVFVNLNATKFCLQFDGVRTGSAVDLGVVFDTAFHIIEVWSDGGGKYHCRIDGGAEIGSGVTPTTPPGDGLVWADAYDAGVAGVDHQIDRDWCLYLFPRS